MIGPIRLALFTVAILGLHPGSPELVSAADRSASPSDTSADEERKSLLHRVQMASPATPGGKPLPNFVLILADDLGYGDTGRYGSKTIPTPHIDALAQAGVWLTDAYATASSCSPSRAGLLTGRYQQRYGFEFNTGGAAEDRQHRGLDPRAVTLAEVVKRAGYATGAFGKWHLGSRPEMHPQSRGFDEFFGFLSGEHSYFPDPGERRPYLSILRGREPVTEPEYLTDAIAREVAKFIAAHSSEPFFAYVPFNAVHEPMEAAPEYLARFPEVESPEVRTYRAMVSALDDAVGTIVSALDKHGLTERTMVIFLNDNGAPSYAESPSNKGVQSNGPLRMGKMWLFEGGVRVPMIVSWPGVVPPGSVFRGMTSALDVFPTIATAAGLRLPVELEMDGVDLAPFLAGRKEGSPHEALYWSRDVFLAIRKGNWKLIRSLDTLSLYDLSSDIGEMSDLTGQHPEVERELDAELRRWRAEMAPVAWPAPTGRKP